MKNTTSKKALKSAMRQMDSIAYRQGQVSGIQLLEMVVHLQNRADEFPPDVRSSYRSDQAFINGILDVLEPCLGDTLSRPRNKVIEAIRESIMRDFFDNARGALIQLRERTKESRSPIPSPVR